MGRLTRQGTRRHAVWVVHQRVVKGRSRTNNDAEVGHKRKHVEFEMGHPTKGKFAKFCLGWTIILNYLPGGSSNP
ncbi:hypothetical protein HZS_1560 [Henneguya salminicola]|nr:hypothetical protein HZS_1560 [Henneguya salminicola]